MDFTATYTTDRIITADKTGTEAKKVVLNEEAYSLGAVIQELVIKIDQLRTKL